MSAKIEAEGDNLYVLHVSGILKRNEFDAGQSTVGREIETGARPRLLVVLQDFEGWERDADWNDIDFMLTRGAGIAKIAIVGQASWKPGALAFAGAGFRSAPVKFFLPEQIAEARSWLAG